MLLYLETLPSLSSANFAWCSSVKTRGNTRKMTLTPKQRLAMLVDENELPKKPPAPPPVPKPEPDTSSPASSRSHHYYSDSDDGIDRGPKHNERRLNAELPERFKKLPTNDSSASPTQSPAQDERTSRGEAQGHSMPAVGTATTGSFCPISAISKFPYKYIRDSTAKQNVASGFFDSQKFWDNRWDL